MSTVATATSARGPGSSSQKSRGALAESCSSSVSAARCSYIERSVLRRFVL